MSRAAGLAPSHPQDFHPYIVELPEKAGPADLDAHIDRADPEILKGRTAFVIRVEKSLLRRVLHDPDQSSVRAALRRADNKPIYILTFDPSSSRHRIRQLSTAGLIPVRQQAEIVAITRTTDLLRTLDEADEFCFHRADDSHHFLTPSLKHCSTFLRVGDAVRSVAALDRIAFWLQPSIASAGALLIDNWSIAVPVLRAMQLVRRTIPFDCLAGHPRYDFVATRAILENLLKPTAKIPYITAIISVNSSGTLLSDMKRALRSLGRTEQEARFVCLFNYKNAPASGAEVLCELRERAENYSSDRECTMCQKGSIPWRMHPRLYFIKEIPETPKSFTPRYQDICGEAIRNCTLPGALRVHRDEPGGVRHHAFYVDVSTLAGQTPWLQRLEALIRQLRGTPDLIVSPTHEAGRALASFASRTIGAPTLIHDTLRLSELSQGDITRLREAHHLLVLDDVLITGTRLSRYLRSLRDNFPHLSSVDFVVAIVRTQSLAEFETQRKALSTRHTWSSQLLFLDQIVLPRWGLDQCPWCHEYEFLTTISESLPQPPNWLTARLEALANRQHGMDVRPLLLLPDVPDRQLASQSPIGPAGYSSIATLFALASSLQLMRTDPNSRSRLDPRFPTCTVFSADNLQTYSEGLLRAILLRIVRGPEWGHAQQEHLAQQMKEALAEPDQDIVAGELILAVARGALRSCDYELLKMASEKQLGGTFDRFASELNLRSEPKV